MSAYGPVVSIRRLFAILVAVAVLFAPVFTRAGEAQAAVPDHHLQMMESGNCQMPPSDSGEHDTAPAKSCCISMCMAIGIAPPPPVRGSDLKPVPAVSGIPTLHLSYLGEIATPPPRHS